jgi:exosortase
MGSDRTGVRLIALAAVIVLVAYAGYFQSLVHESRTNPYAAHVVFVPVLAAALLWAQRHEFWRLTFRGHRRAVAVLGMALVLLGVGHRSANVSLQALSFVVAITGLLYWAYGSLGVRRTAFVLAFLLLMVPPPRSAVAAISPAVQHFVAGVSGAVLRVLGVPIAQDGILLSLPGRTLEVAEECTGLRFLPILFVFVGAFARVVLPALKYQVLLIALSVPVAIIANLTRVVVTSAGTYFFGPYVVSGPAHYYIGKACWLAALLIMIRFAWLLRARIGVVVTRRRSPSVMAHAA